MYPKIPRKLKTKKILIKSLVLLEKCNFLINLLEIISVRRAITVVKIDANIKNFIDDYTMRFLIIS
jgi:hypothetical protein